MEVRHARSYLFVFIFLLGSYIIEAQVVSSNSWTNTSPFDHKVFIENKGQFSAKTEAGGRALFGGKVGQLEVFFTNRGMSYCYNEAVTDTRSEREHERERNHEGEYEEEKKNNLTIPHSLNVEWVGSNPDAELVGEYPVPQYFTYGDVRDPSGKTGFKANAFEKLLYKNIYPHIDIEYSFPKDSSGIKYVLILHPGADPSVIKMKYDGSKGILLDVFGNLIITSRFGKFTDHAPVAFYSGEETKIIPSAFVTHGSSVGFKVEGYDKSKTLIIDPWTVTPPAFTSTRQAAYDVEYDLQGNTWVYGGAKQYEVIKYNAAGVQQWIYTTIFVTDYYGDFAVDGASGSAYIVEAYRQGAAQVIKIDAAGNQIIVYPGLPQQDEMSRIVYNNCIKKAVIVGGGVSGTCQAGILDTTLATYTPVNVLGAATTLHDISLLAIDNAANCYMASTRSFQHPAVLDNKLLKCPAATLTPNAYMINDGHQFMENASVNYTNSPWQANGVNGFNGIAVSGQYVYTYDGQFIQRRDKLTGAFINSTTVTATPFLCGGITTDDCDNLFVGVEKSVVRMDANFTVLGTTIMTDTVYDVRLDDKGTVYACGKNFVTTFIPPGPLATCNSLSITLTPAGSCGSGSVSASVTGGNPGYLYSWNPGGQTGSSVSGLGPGTYTVTVTDNSCKMKAASNTVTISAASFSTTATATPTSCSSNSGTASANVVIGSSPYTYAWSPSGGNSSTATGLSAGTYSVLVTDATGCTSINTVTVTAPNTPLLSPSSANISCNGLANGTASVTVTGGSAPYTYAWSPAAGTGSAVSGLSAGTYSVVVTDSNGCTQTQSFTITQPNALTAVASATATSCGVNNGSASVTGSGGTGIFTYNWSPSGGNGAVATGLGVGNYSVVVSDANGCTAVAGVSITAQGAPTASVSAQSNTSCNGGNNGSAAVSATGGTSPYTYAWNTTPPQVTPSASALSSGTYTCIVTDGTGCSSVVTVNISQPGAILASATSTATPCGLSNGAANASASGGTGALTYNWLPSGGNSNSATGLASGSYTVIVTDANGCTKVAVTSVGMLNGPTANAGAGAIIIIGDSTVLNGTGGVSYSWSPSSSLSCVTCQNPVASPTVTTTYTLIVTDANGCTDASEVTVIVEPISCSNKPNAGSFYLPNAFSPNADGENDSFCLLGWDECLKEFSIKIFNRWGELIFESDSKSFCWDGTRSEVPMNTGIFAFTAKAVLFNGVKKDLKGNISLIR